MKITNLAIAFTFIFMPLLVQLQLDEQASRQALYTTTRYNQAMATAVQDATFQMRMNSMQDKESDYASRKLQAVDRDAALQTFFSTLFLNFGVDDDVGKDVLQRYVPVVAILDYEGLLVNVYREWYEGGRKVKKRVTLPEIPFAYRDASGNIYRFTLDEHVRVYRSRDDKWYNGLRDELAVELQLPLLQDVRQFEQVRRTTIVNVVQERLAHYINEHNRYTRQLGVTYTFTVPTISKDTWLNTIDDIGVLAFIQGYPIGATERVYNRYALGGARLLKTKNYYGFVEQGRRYAYREDCLQTTDRAVELFASARDAAAEGYYVKTCLRK